MVLELFQLYPRTSIIVAAGLVSLFISIVNFFVLDKKKMRESREKQKEFNRMIKEAKTDDEKMALSKEMMKHTMDQTKHMFKPMIITLIPLLLVFSWLKDVFAETSIAGSWFWYYLVSAIIFSIIFRKLLKLP